MTTTTEHETSVLMDALARDLKHAARLRITACNETFVTGVADPQLTFDLINDRIEIKQSWAGDNAPIQRRSIPIETISVIVIDMQVSEFLIASVCWARNSDEELIRFASATNTSMLTCTCGNVVTTAKAS